MTILLVSDNVGETPKRGRLSLGEEGAGREEERVWGLGVWK